VNRMGEVLVRGKGNGRELQCGEPEPSGAAHGPSRHCREAECEAGGCDVRCVLTRLREYYDDPTHAKELEVRPTSALTSLYPVLL
jgi:hypothetical protein